MSRSNLTIGGMAANWGSDPLNLLTSRGEYIVTWDYTSVRAKWHLITLGLRAIKCELS